MLPTALYLRLRVEIKPQARKDLEQAPEILVEEMERGLRESLLVMESEIKKQITSIHLIDKGRLRSSIHGDVISVDAKNFRGEVSTGSDVIYARIHELGGTILPVNAKILVWVDKGVTRPANGDKAGWAALRKLGRVHYAKKVTIKAKHYMRDGANNASQRIARIMRKAVRNAWTRILYEKGDVFGDE